MPTFKFFWNAHRWTGIVVAAVVVTSSVTGFMLLLKKRVDWIQPPTLQGAAGGAEDFITVQSLLDVVFAQDNPEFSVPADIDRIDLHPSDRVFKVISKHHYAELQVCAVTGRVMSSGRHGRTCWRTSTTARSGPAGGTIGQCRSLASAWPS